uniref:Putative secreted protein n=1 Tax=Panstrongylus lignarius TaxID=156445 RepID=A0A224XS05_9HEMI
MHSQASIIFYPLLTIIWLWLSLWSHTTHCIWIHMLLMVRLSVGRGLWSTPLTWIPSTWTSYWCTRCISLCPVGSRSRSWHVRLTKFL